MISNVENVLFFDYRSYMFVLLLCLSQRNGKGKKQGNLIQIIFILNKHCKIIIEKIQQLRHHETFKFHITF